MNNAIKKELKDNGVMVLTLNRPEVLNAMNHDLIMGLYEIFQEIEKEKDSRVIIITGEGRGLTGNCAASIPTNTLSSSAQHASHISGSITKKKTTIKKKKKK